MVEGFSIIMPTYNQGYFINKAILSVKRQTYAKWELIIIDDGSNDITSQIVSPHLADSRIHYIQYSKNQGMGHALNRGLEVSAYDHIAYLPSDDFYDENHLESLKQTFDKDDTIVLVYSGIRYKDSDSLLYNKDTRTHTCRKDYCLQLVQTAHKKTKDRWTERENLITENLFIMFWNKLICKGKFMPTQQITAQWVNHPFQRHKICSETYGGSINWYRSHYKVDIPLKIRMSKYKTIDELELYDSLKSTIKRNTESSLKILIIGCLLYNPERIQALEEQGCTLYGFWIPKPIYSFETVGKFAFGNIIDIPNDDEWIENIKKIKPDIIYGVASYTTLPFVYESIKTLKRAGVDSPFVWHFKEGPHACIYSGMWDSLCELYLLSDGNIYLNPLFKHWLDLYLPLDKEFMISDLDMPKINYFKNDLTSKLSASDHAVHTVVPGRMIGFTPEEIFLLAQNNIHIHLYTEGYHKAKDKINAIYKQAAPFHFHIHPHCPNTQWTQEFSKYDAGWLHCFNSENFGDPFKISWDDINLPARMGALAAAGLPMIQKNQPTHSVASQEVLKEYGIGILYNSIEDLISRLKDDAQLKSVTDNVLKYRRKFAFDTHVTDFLSFFNKIIKSKKYAE